MAVPTGNNHLVNTTGGSFVSANQGGTVLGNQTVGDIVTKALGLNDNAADFGRTPLPSDSANGLIANQKIIAGGTFAYNENGKYVIRTISDTLSGVASNEMLIPGSDKAGRRSIYKHVKSKGAKTVTKWRANEFTLTGTLDSGASNVSRLMWLNTAGNAAEAPAALNENMWDIADGNATDQAADSAADPTRAIPGEFVMKVDFVTLGVSTGGDFFDYKPITG